MRALIGVPQLFGRLKELRNGFMVEPIGTLTLREGGLIEGYRHPNEGSWIPYSWSDVDSSKCFAFVTEKNNWIPSSTWTQSYNGMAIGHFCDEPESGSAAQRLCLVPWTENAKPKIVYLIASCLKFYERTVPILISQLINDGIQREQIKVVVNGCVEDAMACVDGVDHAYSTHDAWEWSTLYEAPLRWSFDYGFLIHDTNVIYKGFRKSVETFNTHFRWDHLPASQLARCLLGLYSHSFLLRLNPWLKKIDRISKKDGVIAEAAAELLLRANSALVLGDLDNHGEARAAEWRELVDQYNTGSPRVRRSFPAIKLDKFIHASSANPDKL